MAVILPRGKLSNTSLAAGIGVTPFSRSPSKISRKAFAAAARKMPEVTPIDGAVAEVTADSLHPEVTGAGSSSRQH
jgi:hypothetical protein